MMQSSKTPAYFVVRLWYNGIPVGSVCTHSLGDAVKVQLEYSQTDGRYANIHGARGEYLYAITDGSAW